MKNFILLILHKSEKNNIVKKKTKILNERKECDVYAIKKKLELFHEKVLTDRNAYLIIELIQDIHL